MVSATRFHGSLLDEKSREILRILIGSELCLFPSFCSISIDADVQQYMNDIKRMSEYAVRKDLLGDEGSPYGILRHFTSVLHVLLHIDINWIGETIDIVVIASIRCQRVTQLRQVNSPCCRSFRYREDSAGVSSQRTRNLHRSTVTLHIPDTRLDRVQYYSSNGQRFIHLFPSLHCSVSFQYVP